MACESKQWAPSRWSPEKIRLFLKHMRSRVLELPSDGGRFSESGITDALMSIDVALSWLSLPNDPMKRALVVATLTGKPVIVTTLKVLG